MLLRLIGCRYERHQNEIVRDVTNDQGAQSEEFADVGMGKVDEALGRLPKLLSPIGVGLRAIEFHGEP